MKKIREKGRETGGSGYDRNKPRESTKKMSEEERQKRLQEMSENAKWRNENRDKNVTKYKSENKKEEEEVGIKMGDTADMFRWGFVLRCFGFFLVVLKLQFLAQ